MQALYSYSKALDMSTGGEDVCFGGCVALQSMKTSSVEIQQMGQLLHLSYRSMFQFGIVFVLTSGLAFIKARETRWLVNEHSRRNQDELCKITVAHADALQLFAVRFSANLSAL